MCSMILFLVGGNRRVTELVACFVECIGHRELWLSINWNVALTYF